MTLDTLAENRYRCYWCGGIIHFESDRTHSKGNQIPLDEDSSIHRCPNRRGPKYYHRGQ